MSALRSYCTRGVVERIIKHEAKPSALLVGADSADPSHLMVPIDSTHHPSFPYTPADVNFQKLSLPASINMELNFLVTNVHASDF